MSMQCNYFVSNCSMNMLYDFNDKDCSKKISQSQVVNIGTPYEEPIKVLKFQ